MQKETFNSIYGTKEKAADFQQILTLVDLGLGSSCSLCGENKKGIKVFALIFCAKLNCDFLIKTTAHSLHPCKDYS